MARTSEITLDKIPSFTRYKKSDFTSYGNIVYKCYRYNNSFRVFIGKDKKGLVFLQCTKRIPKASSYIGMPLEEFNAYAFAEVCRKVYNKSKGIKCEFTGVEEIVAIED